MTRSCRVALILFLTCSGAHAQQKSTSPDTIEGYWQDSARRILYSRIAPHAYVYGVWASLDQGQTYPAAKEVRRSGAAWEVLDLNFDDADYSVKTLAATEHSVEFIRTTKWSGCAMHHACRIEAGEMICTLENVCPAGGGSIVDWRGEERYVRRASCERLGRVQLQGYPVSCR